MKGKHNSRKKKARARLIHGLTLKQVDELIADLKRAVTRVDNKDHPVRGPHYRKQLRLWQHRRIIYHGGKVT